MKNPKNYLVKLLANKHQPGIIIDDWVTQGHFLVKISVLGLNSVDIAKIDLVREKCRWNEDSVLCYVNKIKPIAEADDIKPLTFERIESADGNILGILYAVYCSEDGGLYYVAYEYAQAFEALGVGFYANNNEQILLKRHGEFVGILMPIRK